MNTILGYTCTYPCACESAPISAYTTKGDPFIKPYLRMFDLTGVYGCLGLPMALSATALFGLSLVYSGKLFTLLATKVPDASGAVRSTPDCSTVLTSFLSYRPFSSIRACASPNGRAAIGRGPPVRYEAPGEITGLT